LPDSCTHIAIECKSHNYNQFINIHNAACKFTHATIKTAFNGGGAIYSPNDLRLISMDARTKHQTTNENLSDLNTPSPRTQCDLTPSSSNYTAKWIAPAGTPPKLHKNRRVDVSIDTKTLPTQGEVEMWDEEGVAAPRYIPACVLPREDLDNLMATGAGAAPDIIYAQGVPVDPSPDPASFSRKEFPLIFL